VASGQRRKCSPVVALPTPENQRAFDGENQRDRWPTYDLHALYRPGLDQLDLKESGDKAARIEKKQCLLLLQPDFAPRAPSSRPCASCNKQPAGVLELAELERRAPQRR
jgi:hypothetical protein